MKKNIPDKLTDQPTLFIKKIPLFTFDKISFLLVFIFYTMMLSAQQKRIIAADQVSNISHIDRFLESQKVSASLRSSDENTSLYVETLIYDLQPSVYFMNGTEKTYGDNPVCLFTDVQSLSAFKNSSLKSDAIEIITIKIKSEADLNLTIDLSLFSGFPKLKYIYVLSEIKVSEKQIIKLIQNNNPKLNIFFNAVKGS